MLKNAVVVGVAVLALAPSIASAELAVPKKSSRRAAIEATRIAMKAALTVDGMVDKINGAYMTGLRRCYNRGLAKNPGLTGTVTVTFTVGAFGVVTGEAEGISKQVDACVAKQIRRWNFGKPADVRASTYRIALKLAQ